MRRPGQLILVNVKKYRNNMVKGRRKRGTNKGVVHSRTAPSVKDNNELQSPAKKEIKIENTKKMLTNTPTGTRSISQPYKSPVCITSYFCAQATNIKTELIKDEKYHTQCFFTEEQLSICDQNVGPDAEHFTTDETPVAVPIHNPSTPHRINMPNNNAEECDERNITNDIDKKPVVFVPVQATVKKPAARGRRKPTHSQMTHRELSAENANHKLTDYFPVRRSVRKCKKAVLEEKQRDMENKVLCQVEEGLEIRQFPGKGRGIVTTREFTKGEFVVEYIGELVDLVVAKKREKLYAQDHTTGCYMYYFQHRNHQYCVDATAETDKLGRLVNHSRNGNLIARVVEVESVPHLVLTAKEDIPVGVEITYDYGDRSREAIRHHPWLAL